MSLVIVGHYTPKYHELLRNKIARTPSNGLSPALLWTDKIRRHNPKRLIDQPVNSLIPPEREPNPQFDAGFSRCVATGL